VQATDPDECWLCGHCVAVCPADAINHSEFLLSECPKIETSLLPSLENIVTAFRERRSTRVFSNKAVPREIVGELIDTARWVPSAANEQPVEWTVIDNPERITAFGKKTADVLLKKNQAEKAKTDTGEISNYDYDWLASQTRKGNDLIFFNAPVLLIAHTPENDIFGRDDSVYASYNLMLAAERMGLGTCLTGFFISAMTADREIFNSINLPDNHKADAALVLGYPKYQFHRVIPRHVPPSAFIN
jgi:nitroreductase